MYIIFKEVYIKKKRTNFKHIFQSKKYFFHEKVQTNKSSMS